jgi:hypothetical protein
MRHRGNLFQHHVVAGMAGRAVDLPEMIGIDQHRSGARPGAAQAQALLLGGMNDGSGG